MVDERLKGMADKDRATGIIDKYSEQVNRELN
jgi:hypothetical protein